MLEVDRDKRRSSVWPCLWVGNVTCCLRSVESMRERKEEGDGRVGVST